MEITNRVLTVFGIILVGFGILLLGLNFIPGWSMAMAWPVIFFILSALFVIPILMFPLQRQWVSAFFIPASILVMLGLIFLYNTITRDWVVWAYAWLLIITGVGAGMALASWYGGWGRDTITVGIWMMLISLVAFSVFGAIFGGPVLRAVSPVVLTLGGVVLLVRALRK
jgi:hypothetical protein